MQRDIVNQLVVCYWLFPPPAVLKYDGSFEVGVHGFELATDQVQ
jgi:hypothetical protein